MIDKPYFLYLLSPFRWGRLGSIVNSLGQEREDNLTLERSSSMTIFSSCYVPDETPAQAVVVRNQRRE